MKVVQLNESQLYQVITEATSKILREYNSFDEFLNDNPDAAEDDYVEDTYDTFQDDDEMPSRDDEPKKTLYIHTKREEGYEDVPPMAITSEPAGNFIDWYQKTKPQEFTAEELVEYAGEHAELPMFMGKYAYVDRKTQQSIANFIFRNY